MLRVEGVGDARLLSQSSYTMRLWLRPDRMAQLGLDATDVASAAADPERADPGRPDRRAAAGLAAGVPVPGQGPGFPADGRGVRQHHPALQPGRLADPRAGCRAHRAGRAVVQHHHAHEQRPGRVPGRVPGHRRRRAAHGARHPRADGVAQGQLPARRRLRDLLRHHAADRGLDGGDHAHPGRSHGAGPDRGVPVPAELARDPDPDADRAGLADRDLRLSSRCWASRSTC